MAKLYVHGKIEKTYERPFGTTIVTFAKMTDGVILYKYPKRTWKKAYFPTDSVVGNIIRTNLT